MTHRDRKLMWGSFTSHDSLTQCYFKRLLFFLQNEAMSFHVWKGRGGVHTRSITPKHWSNRSWGTKLRVCGQEGLRLWLSASHHQTRSWRDAWLVSSLLLSSRLQRQHLTDGRQEAERTGLIVTVRPEQPWPDCLRSSVDAERSKWWNSC